MIPVEGKITGDEGPLTRGSIAFHPDNAKNNTSKKTGAADITPEGTFQLYTDGKPGAPAGWYKVTVVSTGEPDNTKPEAVKSFVAPRFSDPKLTELSAEVKSGGSYDFKVTSK